MSASSIDGTSSTGGSEKKPWHRNSYVTAYWEMEDVALDVYEMALVPIMVLGGVIVVYLLAVVTGVGFVLLGHLLLRGIVPASGIPTLAAYINYPLVATLELSSIGAAIFALPVMFAGKYLPMDPRCSKTGVLLSILSKIILALSYGALSGAAGSGILLAAMPWNSGVTLPADVAAVAGVLGALSVAPPFVLITWTLLYWQRKRCPAPLNSLAPRQGSMAGSETDMLLPLHWSQVETLLAQMDSLIAQANAIAPVKSGKSESKPRIKPKSASIPQPDATLASIAAHTRVPKSLSNTLDGDVREKKRAAKKGKYGHINDLKLRAHLSQMEEGRKDRKDRMEDVQMLNVGEAGGMEVEGVLERTWKMTQQEIVGSVGMEDGRSRADWRLDGGPYACRYSRNGRHLAIAGRQGHVATFDWQTGTIHAELQLKETCRDITFLQDHTMFAVAQSKYVYMYDLNGVELHRLAAHIEPTKLEYLPYHFLLVSASNTGFLKYQDISTGQTVVEHRSKLGPCRTMCQNPWNAVIQLGHQNGTVTLWTPNSPTPHVRLLAHLGEVTALAVDGSSSGRYMATSGADGRVKVWDCRNWKGCLRQWSVRTGTSHGFHGAQLDWSQKGMLAVGASNVVNVFRQPAITSLHTPLAPPPLYMAHPTPRSQISSIRFIPHRDLLAISHSSSSDKSGVLAHDHVISTILIPGSGNPNYDTAEGGDPHEGGKGRREREVRSLLEKLEPSTITVDPEILGGLREPGKVDESLVHRKQPRMQRLQATGKADVTEVPGDEEDEGSQSGEENSEVQEKKKARKMRGRDKSMKRYLRKKRKNVVDEATVAIRTKLEKQRSDLKKAQSSEKGRIVGQEDGKRSALDRFKIGPK